MKHCYYTLFAIMLLLAACKKEEGEPATLYFCPTKCQLRYPQFVFPADEYSPEDLDSVSFRYSDVSDTTYQYFSIGDTIQLHDEKGRLLYAFDGFGFAREIIIPATNQFYSYQILSYPDLEQQYLCGAKPPSCTKGISDIVIQGGHYSVSEHINNEYFIYLEK